MLRFVSRCLIRINNYSSREGGFVPLLSIIFCCMASLKPDTIPSGSQTSGGVQVTSRNPTGVVLSGAGSLTSTTMKFDVTWDGGDNWYTLKDESGSDVSVDLTGGDGKYPFPISAIHDVSEIRANVGSNEGADRDIEFVVDNIYH